MMPSTAMNIPRLSPSAASVLAGDYSCPPMVRALPVTARVPVPTAVLHTNLDPMRAVAGVGRDLVDELLVTCDWGIR